MGVIYNLRINKSFLFDNGEKKEFKKIAAKLAENKKYGRLGV